MPPKRIKFVVKKKPEEAAKPKKKIKFVVKKKEMQKPEKKKVIKFKLSEKGKRLKEMKPLVQEGIDLLSIVLKNTNGFSGGMDLLGFNESDFEIPANINASENQMKFGSMMKDGTTGLVRLHFTFATTNMYIPFGKQKDKVLGEVMMQDERGFIQYYKTELVNGKFTWTASNLDRIDELRNSIQIARNEVRKGKEEPTQNQLASFYDALNKFKEPLKYQDNYEFYFKHRLAIADQVLKGILDFEALNA